MRCIVVWSMSCLLLYRRNWSVGMQTGGILFSDLPEWKKRRLPSNRSSWSIMTSFMMLKLKLLRNYLSQGYVIIFLWFFCSCSEQNMDPVTYISHVLMHSAANWPCSIYFHNYLNSCVISLYLVLIVCNNYSLSLPCTAVSCMWEGLHWYSKWASRKR